jgi:ADP-ribose pyrophosphatase
MKPYKTISKSIVFKNPWWRYCLDRIELPSGKHGEYHYAATDGSSMIAPVAQDGKLLLVRQYRYTGNRDSIEFPCGGLKGGATHDETAKHELVEETGYMPGKLKSVGSFNPCNGLIDEICMVFIAWDLHYVGPQPDETEFLELVPLTMEELEASVRNGTIWDGMTLAAWSLVRPILLQQIS